MNGRWCYLYRSVDRDGNLVDSMLSKRRDMVAAKRFFKAAVEEGRVNSNENVTERVVGSTVHSNENVTEGDLPPFSGLSCYFFYSNV